MAKKKEKKPILSKSEVEKATKGLNRIMTTKGMETTGMTPNISGLQEQPEARQPVVQPGMAELKKMARTQLANVTKSIETKERELVTLRAEQAECEQFLGIDQPAKASAARIDWMKTIKTFGGKPFTHHEIGKKVGKNPTKILPTLYSLQKTNKIGRNKDGSFYELKQ